MFWFNAGVTHAHKTYWLVYARLFRLSSIQVNSREAPGASYFTSVLNYVPLVLASCHVQVTGKSFEDNRFFFNVTALLVEHLFVYWICGCDHVKEVKSSEYFYLHDRRIGSKSSRVNEIVLNVSYHFLSGTYYKTWLRTSMKVERTHCGRPKILLLYDGNRRGKKLFLGRIGLVWR